ncbi:MAG: hypothetical protein ABI047_04355 [Jatrophihabitantaceae bacterium]
MPPRAYTTFRPAETESTTFPAALPRAVLAACAGLWVATVETLIAVFCPTEVDSTRPVDSVTTTKSPP